MPAKKETNASFQKPLLPTDKIPLPAFLRMLTDGGVSTKNAMAVAAKVYKEHNTGEQLAGLNNVNLAKLGIGEKELRRDVLTAIKHAGYSAPKPTDRNEHAQNLMERHQKATEELLKPSSPSKKRKRARDDDMLLPTAPKDEAASLPNLDYKENKNEVELMTRSVVVNRAPVMMAWAAVVAEKLGFTREEALSIASVYTEMNATAKGVATGIYEKGKEKGMEPNTTTAQPHVELMGRRIALIQTENEQWRGLMKGLPISPAKAYSYITRSFAQMTPYLMGALVLLADAYSDPQALNRAAYSLYCDFRPESERWGGKGEVKLAAILGLRPGQSGSSVQVSGAENAAEGRSEITGGQPELSETAAVACAPNGKKRKVDSDVKTAEVGPTEDGLDQDELAQFMADLDEMNDGDEINRVRVVAL